MVKCLAKYVILLVVGLSFTIAAQPNTFVRASVNAKKVKVKQPLELRISVYTPTWFTSAPNLDNIAIPGALTIRKDRAHSRYENINDVRYTILYFDFIIFPMKEGELLIPEILMQFSSPEEGDYKGKQVEKKTKSLKVIVDSLSNDFKLSNWLVANSFYVSEKWNKNLNSLKVGDVVERTLTLKASGTLAALIPSSDSISISWGRVYPKTPKFRNEIKNEILQAERIEQITLLLEKPGEFIIPEESFLWWNPVTKKNYTRKLPEKKFIIAENPDLAILKSIQDSLDAISNAGQTEQIEEKPFTLFGLLIWQLVIVLALTLVVIVQFKKIIIYIIQKIKERKAAYLQSEKYYFKQIGNTCKQDDLLNIQANFFRWIAKLTGDKEVKPIKDFILNYGSEELINTFSLLEKKLYAENQSSEKFDAKLFYKQLSIVRKNYLKMKNRVESVNLKLELNP